MKFIVNFLFLILTILICGCEDSKNDKLQFNDPFPIVQKNVLALDSLFKYNAFCNSEGYIDFSDNKIQIIGRKNEETYIIKNLCFSAQNNWRHLVEITNILRKNNIKLVYSQYGDSISIFEYYTSPNQEAFQVRRILIYDDVVKHGLPYGEYILARKGKLVLTAIRKRD